MLFLQADQRLDIQMVVMVVCDQDQVNRRQVSERKARIAHASRSNVAEGTDALRVDRIRKNVQAAELQQEGDVIDEGEGDLTAVEVRWQRGCGLIVDPVRPGCTL